MAEPNQSASKEPKVEPLSEELKRSLYEICDHFEKEDLFVRERQLRLMKRMKYYWDGFQRIWWSETAHDWKIYDNRTSDLDSDYYDKPINIFRAYLESIVAALSVTVPPIKCTPDDAENSSDILTAKSGDKIADLVYKHNDAPLLWIHGLFLYCTEGLIAGYNYAHSDKKYGTYDEPKFEDVQVETPIQTCPNCGTQFPTPDESQEPPDVGDDEFQPDDQTVQGDELDQYQAEMKAQGMSLCPQCQSMVFPEAGMEPKTISRMIGVTASPKTRQCVEVYGGLNVKIGAYARVQKETPYLRYAYETHFAEALAEYPQLYDESTGAARISPGGVSGVDIYERWARLPSQYGGDFPENVVTCRKYWLRPCSFNVINDKTKRDALAERFPDGCKVEYVNDEYVSSENEALDDHWSLARNPLSNYIQYDPLGLLLTSIQEISNEIISLVLQTMEHGIPQTFADPKALDFDLYRKTEVAPGSIFPIKSQTKPIGEFFYEVKTATLSQEVFPFAQKIQEMGQFVSGAMPAIFGQMESKTAAQDSMSKAQALQRLQNVWKMLNYWWKDIFGKVIPQFMKDVKEDEKYSVRDKQNKNNFINVVIRKSELEGKLGEIELEAADQLPMTWAQQKDVIMQLMQAQNPEIMAAMGSPENAAMVASAIGLMNFYVPGEDDRLQQFDEIAQLLQSEPIQTGMVDPMTGEPQMEPSVPIDQLLDNHQIGAEICRKWAISPQGRQCKIDNPPGYENVMLHYKAHFMVLQQMNAMSVPPEGQEGEGAEGAAPAPKPKKPSSAAAAKSDDSGDGGATAVH